MSGRVLGCVGCSRARHCSTACACLPCTQACPDACGLLLEDVGRLFMLDMLLGERLHVGLALC
jgi:hypothetical protein